MAIVKGPALSLAASGNLGDICYSPWRSLQVARSTWTGTVPNTTLQVEQQDRVITVAQAWSGVLTSDQRESWRSRARTVIWKSRFGDPYIPSGYQLFMKWNIRRLVISLTIQTVAPVAQEWVYCDNLDLFINPGGSVINMTLLKDSVLPIDGYGVEYYKAGPYDGGGRHPIEGEWRFFSRRVPPARKTDVDVIPEKWYWIRSRAITEFGDVQNWFEKQIQVVP